MIFLHPWALAVGAAAVVLPVAIHWLTRPRPVRLPLSTIRFVREAVQQRRARHRLRDWLILALRTLAVVLVAWAVARPLLGQQPLVAPVESGNLSRVVLLDVSQSMSALAHGIEVFERARPLAAGYLANQSGVQANLILAGSHPRAVFDRLSTNLLALREELAAARPRPERLNVQGALNLAAEMLARSTAAVDARRELVVISDFQRTNWTSADFHALPEDAQVQLVSVAPREELPNLAVLQAGIPGRVEQGREARLEVEVGNFSSTPRRIQVAVSIGSQVYRLDGLCSPQSKTTLTTEAKLSTSGWLSGEARLEGVQDALPADDLRPFTVFVRPRRWYALLTRERADQRPSSSYFLERALVPALPGPGQPQELVVRVDPTHADREVLAARGTAPPAELLALDHPGRLSADTIQLLANLVRRGRGLFYVVAEAVDATNLNLLAEAAGSDWHLPVRFLPPGKERRRNLFLTDIRRAEPPFHIFGDNLSALVGALRFNGGLPSQRIDAGLGDDILAGFSDGSAALIVTSCGAGNLAVLNCDLAGSNLPGSPAFVPLVGELVNRLVGAREEGGMLLVGEPIALRLPVTAGPLAGLQIQSPEPSSVPYHGVGAVPGGAVPRRQPAGELVEEEGQPVWRSTGLPGPGVYQVRRGDVPVFAVAAALPPEESDLRTLDPAVFQERLAGSRTVHYRSAADAGDERDTLWSWLAAGCALCLLAELAVLKAFRT